jgi:hypothetical protein
VADESEVEDALCDFVVSILYPTGTDDLDETSASACGAPAKVQRGMPLATDLEQMLGQGMVDVAVGARNGVERVTTRYGRDWYDLIPATTTLTATVTGATVIIGGTVTAPQNVAVQVGRAILFIYQVQPADTLATVAAGLAAGLSGQGAPAIATGPTLTVSSADPVKARVGGYGTAARELKRQEKSFQITLFAPSTEMRDAMAKLIDPALSELNFLTLPDGTFGLVRYERTIVADTLEKMGQWRRDLFYWVEFPTIETRLAPQVISFAINATGISTSVPQPVQTTLA